MVARTSSATGFSPAAAPRVTVAADGTLAAVQEPERITIIELPSCAPFAELGTDPAAASCQAAWLGTPPRIIVLSAYEAHSVVHLIDPFGPRTIAEIRLASAMRLCAATGTHALAIGASGAAVLSATDRYLTPYPFPARSVPSAAGAAGAHFVVALPSAIEEWDPQARMPKRRLKLPRPATITALGGSERVVWMTTQQEPSLIEVIPFVNRGQPRAHELPEPIASVASHPRSDVIACIGATSGRLWVVDLDGRTGLRVIGPEGIERAEAVGIVLGRVAGVLAAQALHRVAVVPLEPGEGSTADREAASRPASPPRARLYGEDDDAEVGLTDTPTTVTLASPAHGEPRPATVAPPSDVGPATRATVAVVPSPAPPQAPPLAAAPKPEPAAVAQVRADTDDEHSHPFAAWRARLAHPRAPTSEPHASAWTDAPSSWRDDVLDWTRRILAGGEPEPIEAPPIVTLALRCELSGGLEPVLALLYGAHLLGDDGAAPADVARVLAAHPQRWSEALGRGELAERGIASYERSRVRLTEPLQRALDELRPRTGTLVGSPGAVSLLGPCAIVASGPTPIIAEACLPAIGGAILAAHEGAEPQALVDEARAFGAAPLWRVRAEKLADVPSDRPIILVVEDDATAEQLDVPRLT